MPESALVQDIVNLVIAARRGDADAFQSLVQRYQDFAYAAAFARLGDRQLAQDVAQEAFLQAHADLHTLREPRAFGGWLRRLVGKYSDRMLRGKHLVTIPLDAALIARDTQAQPHEIAEASELAELVRFEINRLPEHERLAVALYYVADRPQREIAEFLEVPLSTIKKRLHDARRRLRERLMSEFGEHLRELRPSLDERFAQRVHFLIAVRTGDLEKVESQLAADPSLLEATLSGEDWGRAEVGQPTLPLEFDYTPLQRMLAALSTRRYPAGLSPSLLRTFKSTNPVESMISIGRTVAGNVKRWGTAGWCCAGLQPASSKPRSNSGGSTATGKWQSSAAHSSGIINDLHLPKRSPDNQRWIARSSTISRTSSRGLVQQKPDLWQAIDNSFVGFAVRQVGKYQ